MYFVANFQVFSENESHRPDKKSAKASLFVDILCMTEIFWSSSFEKNQV